EYETENGNGATAIAAAVATISEMSAIYKRDLAVELTANVVAENPTIFDVIPPGGASASYAGTVVSAYFSSGSYDLGHVFHNTGGSGGSGQAGLGVVCNNNGSPINKARGWSQANPNNDYGFLSIVVHEVAHMFSATHTFNGNDAAFCGPALNASTSYEPGSGTTLMAYPGVCGAQNITDTNGNTLFNSTPFFHVANLEQMVNYINGNGNSCASSTGSGNTPPIANANPCNAGSPITIPINTPFELTGSATDIDNDELTYSWEQFDAGPPHGAPNVACGNASGPIFRSYIPSPSPTRTFPSLEYVLNDANVPSPNTVGECLPSVSRVLNFKLTVRDNNSLGGGMHCDDIQLQVSGTAGPLAITAPNTSITQAAGSTLSVTWNVNSTNSICATSNILLSVDGGITYPYVLEAGTANDGSQTVNVPSNVPNTTQARVRVESSCLSCVKFFDVSNTNFTITSNCMVSVSSVCPANQLTAPQNDPSLNLGLTQAYGNAINSKTLTTSGSNVNVSYNLTPSASGPGTCTNGNFGWNQSSFRIKISQAGDYTFTMGASRILSVYNGPYTTSSPCVNYIGSTGYDSDGTPGGSVSFSNQLTLNLTNVCGEYTIVLFGANGTTETLSITGPSGSIVYEHNPQTIPDYSYTFVSVNTVTNLITNVSSTSNFTNLSPGTYSIYGVHYYSGSANPPGNVNPTSFIGQTINALLASGNCMLASGNFKPLTITGSCPALSTAPANVSIVNS
ncbi:MAG TPA: M12 family metallo-peptidase, partial [Saprospiraceae bacterium]|nr:M12 family metallo-peptidase [Saprospiraceae bacterium]